MRILVIGGSGLVGSNIVETASSRGHDTIGTYRESPTQSADVRLEKTNAAATIDRIADIEPDAIIDTAAFHDVDACETERERAWAVNAQGTRNVAVAADEIGALFAYVSTDYVFAGDPDETPYQEDDPIAPINYYARTKYAGEQAAGIVENSLVLRPSVIYGLASDNFALWALGELRAGTALDIVDDQVSRPTYAPDLGQACVTALELGLTGVYHASGPESVSRYAFTVQLARSCGYDPAMLSPISTDELGQTAVRPRDSSLDSRKLYEATDLTFRNPKRGLDHLCSRRESTP